MALIKCPECGKEISNTAKQCPHCGFTLKTNIDAAKQAASVAGNAVLNALLKYGYSIIPFALLVIGMLYLLIGFDNWYYGFFFMDCTNGACIHPHIETPFSEDSFYLPLIATIVFPFGILIVCRKAYKKKVLDDTPAIQQSKFSKHIVLWMILVYLVGFAALSAIFYSDYTKAKEEQVRFNRNGISATATSQWVYSEETNLAGARIHYATILAEEDESIVLCLTYDPDNYIEVNDLVVKYFDKSISIVSNWATIKRGISFRFDDGGIINLTPSTLPSHDVYITDKSISIRDECEDFSRLMQLLKTSKVCKVEITTSNGIKTYTFNVAGLNWPAF